jgi:hypothetical protein
MKVETEKAFGFSSALVPCAHQLIPDPGFLLVKARTALRRRDKNIRAVLKLIKYPAIVARKLQDGLIQNH